MSENYPMHEMYGQTTECGFGSTSTVVNFPRHLSSAKSRAFDLTHHDKEQALVTYMLSVPMPDLIIKLVGINHEHRSVQTVASVQNAFILALRTLLQQTRIWVINGTLAMLDLPEEGDIEMITEDEQIPNVVVCEPFNKSLLFEHHPTAFHSMNKILSNVQQQITNLINSYIPTITLVVQGDTSSAIDIVESVSQNIPVLILKGTGPIANQLAAFFEPVKHRNMSSRVSVNDEFNRLKLSDVDLRRLTHMNDTEQALVFLCQPGKNELDESILRAIDVVSRLMGKSNVLTDGLHFAMRWNKIEFARLHLLNYNTVIEWTNDELDQCLEIAIRLNAVPFVELLLDYGASLQRLALVGNHDHFRRKSEVKESRLSMIIIQTVPIVSQVDAATRAAAYLRLLFHSAVENRNVELVLSMCARLEDFITGMLLVSIWCQYSQNNDSITSAEFRKYRQQFELYAAEVLDLCYADNEQQAVAYLNQKSILYRDQQAIVLIDDLCSKSLTSTKCMQSHTNAVWYGDYFQPNKDTIWEVVVSLTCLCPLLLLIPWVKKRIFLPYDLNEYRSDRNNFWQIKLEPWRRFYSGNVVIRFRYTVFSYIAFLLLFSYTLLFDYYPLNIYDEYRSNIYKLPIPLPELFLHIFLASFAFDEVKQVISHARSFRTKTYYWKNAPNVTSRISRIWSYYRNDRWNILDFIAFTLWIMGLVTRFIVTREAFELSKICMSLDLCLWYMRCLHVFLASEHFGPKLLMIFHTMKDLMSFLFFILAFLFAYTISSYALISTSSYVIWSDSTNFSTIQNGTNLTRTEIIRHIIEWGTWKIFGSTSLTTSESVEMKYFAKNDAYGFVTLFLTIAFLVVAYVLLLNNLIALFNFTIQRVHGESRRAWFYHFYVLVREYREKDMLVPPFNMILWPLSYYLNTRFHNNDTSNSKEVDTRAEQQSRRRQQRIAEQYWKAKRASNDLSLNIQSYVCRQCKCRGTEADYIESTTFF